MTEEKKAKKLFSIDIEVILYATPEEVFESMTDEKIMQKWIEGACVFQPVVNGKVSLFDGWVSGEVLEFDPGLSLAYTWKPNTWTKKTQASIVQIEFEENEAGTKMILSHRGFPNEKEAADHREGWFSYFIDPLNDYYINNM